MVREKLLEEKLTLNITKIAVLAVSLIVATFAWLTSNTQGNVNQMSVSTNAHNEIYISLNDGATWTSSANLNIPSNFSFNSEVTGSGVNLYHALTRDSSGVPLTYGAAISNHDYYEFDIMFKSNIPTKVFLDDQSYVHPLAGTLESELLGTLVTNKSTIGDFSRDLIAGSVRVAVIEHTYSGGNYTIGSTTSLVWAPNKNYEISEASEVFTASINSTNSQSYNYVHVASGNPSGYLLPTNLKDNLNANKDSNISGGDPYVVNCINEVDGLFYSKATIRIWVEGNDRDTILAVKGGKFAVMLSFLGVLKNDDMVEPTVTADLVLNKLIGFDNTMEYSTDYGNNWTTYQINNDPTFTEGATVYVRKSETTNNHASVYKTLNY